MIKPRDRYFDFIRGIAVIFVLWGHCIQYGMVAAGDFFENPIFKAIYSFHMPLFMLVSGYLFFYSAKKTLKELLVSRFRSLGYPLLIWGCARPFFKFLKAVLSDGKNIEMIGIFIDFLHNCVDGITGIWFLWAALVISVIMTFAEKIYLRGGKGKIVYAGILLAGGMAICILPGRVNNLFMYPYFIIGCCLHRLVSPDMKYVRWIERISIVLYSMLLIFYSRDCYIYTSGLWIFNRHEPWWRQLGIDLYRYMVGLFGSIAVLSVAKKLYSAVNKESLVSSLVIRLGTISLEIYILQRYLVERFGAAAFSRLVNYMGENYFAKNLVVFDFVITSLAAVAAALIMDRIIYALQRVTVSKYVFGR